MEVVGICILALMGIFFHCLQEDNPLAVFKLAAQRIRNLNQKIAQRFHTSTTVIVRFEIGALLAFGFTPMQIGEWAVSVACWVILGFMLLAKGLAWEGIRGSKGLTAFLRSFSVLGAIALSVLLITITTLRKPETEPWSNIQKLWMQTAPTINPSKVAFRSVEIHDNYIFTVRNKTDHDVYAVVAKFKIVSGDLSAKDLSLDIPLSSRKSVMEKGRQVPDAFPMRCLDAAGAQVLIVGFVRLTPDERREITIARDQDRRGTLAAEISHFTTDQLPQRENSGTYDLGEPMYCTEYAVAPAR